MKFNKSAESDFWYVGLDNGYHAGKIKLIGIVSGWAFCPANSTFDGIPFDEKNSEEILAKIKELNRSIGIDTTSTFTSNEDR